MSQIRCAADAARKTQQVDLAAMEASLERLNATVRAQAAELTSLREQLGSHPNRNLALNRPSNQTRVSLGYLLQSPHCAPGATNFWCAPKQQHRRTAEPGAKPGTWYDGRTNNGVPIDTVTTRVRRACERSCRVPARHLHHLCMQDLRCAGARVLVR